MKLYFIIQGLRFLLMCFHTPTGQEGASRSCTACEGNVSAKVIRTISLDEKKGIFHEINLEPTTPQDNGPESIGTSSFPSQPSHDLSITLDKVSSVNVPISKLGIWRNSIMTKGKKMA